jgi:hypothetical protein
MKRIYLAAIAATVLTLPLLSHAGTTGTPATRAQVRAELIAAERAGEYPQSEAHYPDAAPDAGLEYVADRAAARAAVGGSYGSVGSGRIESGVGHFRHHFAVRVQPDNFDIYRGQ